MKATIIRRIRVGDHWDIIGENLETSGPDIAVQGGMFGIEHVVDGKKVWLYLPIKSLIKIEIHE